MPGDTYFSEDSTHRVRRIGSDGIVATVAGNGIAGYTGDGGLATAASLNAPGGLAAGPTGILYIADFGNDRIRAVQPSPLLVSSSATQLTFSATAGSPAAAPQRVAVSATVGGAAVAGAALSARPDSSWLQVSPPSGALPLSVEIAADAAGLSPGRYDGKVQVAVPGATPPAFAIAVTFNVQTALPPKMRIDTTSLTFSFPEGSAPPAQQVRIANDGGGSFTARVQTSVPGGGKWLGVSGASAAVTPPAPGALTVQVDPAGLAAGTYTGSLLVSASHGESATVPVNVTVISSRPVLLLSQRGLTFQAVAQGGAVLPQQIGILNLGGAAEMAWAATASTLSGGSSWLSLSNRTGLVRRPAVDVSLIDVTVNPTGLAAGDYYGRIDVAAPGAGSSPQTVSVVLNVLPAGSNPGPSVSPTSLVFIAAVGSNPSSQNVMIANPAGRSLAYSSSPLTSDGGNWLLHAPRNASVSPSAPARIVVQPDFTGLSAGIRRGTLTLTFDDGSPARTIDILAVVASAGSGAQGVKETTARTAGACAPLVVRATSPSPGFSLPRTQPVTITARVVDNCAQPLTSGAVSAVFNNGDNSVPLVHTRDGYWTGAWQPRSAAVSVGVDVVAVAPFGVAGGRLDSPVTGSLRSGSNLPLISPGAVVNGASFRAGTPVSPGSYITIFGSSLTEGAPVEATSPLRPRLGGTEVVIGDRNLPLRYVSDGQVNAQIPFDLPVNSLQQILVRSGEALSVPELVTVAPAQPVVFTQTATGSGAGVVVNGATNVLVTPATPVRAGDIVVIYGTGLGAVSPTVPEGQPAPAMQLSRTVNPVTVTIGGRPSPQVDFAGLTPNYVGLYQINARIPAGVTGDTVPLTVTVAGQTSPEVMIAVR